MWETLTEEERSRRSLLLLGLRDSSILGFSARRSLVVLGEMSRATAQELNGALMTGGDLLQAAWSATSSPDLLESLAADPDFQVRAAVARNLFTPEGVLVSLANDPDVNVVTGVCGNPLTPAPLLSDLALQSTGWSSPGSHACANPGLPFETLREIADKRTRSFTGVFQNHAATPEILDLGVNARTDELIYWTATNPFLTKAQFEVIVDRSLVLLRQPDFGLRHFRRWQKQIEILETVLDNPGCDADNLAEILTLSGGSPISDLKAKLRVLLERSRGSE